MPIPPLPNVGSRYGAPLGRRDRRAADCAAPIKFYLVRLDFVDGDYDQGGAYWGRSPAHGHVYRAVSAEDVLLAYDYPPNIDQAELYVRGKTRTEAKNAVKETYPNAKFFQ